MNTQQLAEYLETYGPKSNIDRTALLAAAELRRLHEENERLKAQQQEPAVWTATRLWNRKDTWTCPADIEKDLLDGRALTTQPSKPLTYAELMTLAKKSGIGPEHVSGLLQTRLEIYGRAIEAAHGITKGNT